MAHRRQLGRLNLRLRSSRTAAGHLCYLSLAQAGCSWKPSEASAAPKSPGSRLSSQACFPSQVVYIIFYFSSFLSIYLGLSETRVTAIIFLETRDRSDLSSVNHVKNNAFRDGDSNQSGNSWRGIRVVAVFAFTTPLSPSGLWPFCLFSFDPDLLTVHDDQARVKPSVPYTSNGFSIDQSNRRLLFSFHTCGLNPR